MNGRQEELLEAQRDTSTSDNIYQALRKKVIEFELRPEERINELQLAAEFGVSRTPIREVLNRLTAEGFMTFERNRGFFFRSLNIDEIVQIFQLRTILEKGAFEISAAVASDSDMKNFVEYVEERFANQEGFSPDDALVRDEDFHIRLAELSGNGELVSHLTSLNARIRFARRTKIAYGPLQHSQLRDHQTIAATLKDRDVERGKALLDQHIRISIADARLALQEVLLKTYNRQKR